ncbi:hypothetical protein [Rummeliibacillus pycnus]|uniref:hypothetical protein n=1 Tax=Rummeliibacillus pycnus TaxID=101070 RepID=UPI000C9BB4D1|nr:hypothetical protein [Rummeliibacillus pycnus]
MKIVGCLHAHYSNINYLEKALSQYPITLHHFVDPALIIRISTDPSFTTEEAKKKVMEKIEWISAIGVDAIVITCTNYSAILDDTNKWKIPIIKIDEPFFKRFSQLPSPKKLIFTNPETVKGTTKRLNDFLRQKKKTIHYSIEIIPSAFEYLMDGNTKAHNEIVFKQLSQIINHASDNLAVAQLSMAEVVNNINARILNPLDPLIDAILLLLHIDKVDDKIH